MGYEDMTPEEMDKDTDWDKGWGDLIKAETVTPLEELKAAKIPVLREKNKKVYVCQEPPSKEGGMRAQDTHRKS